MNLRPTQPTWCALAFAALVVLTGCGFSGSGSNGQRESDIALACEAGITKNNGCERLEKDTEGCNHVVDNEDTASAACLDEALGLYECMRDASCDDMWEPDSDASCWNAYHRYLDDCEGELIEPL